MKTAAKWRIFYLLTFLTLTAVETLIALFVHDTFIRPYLGDVIVVIDVYCLMRIFIPKKGRLLPLYVFLLAAVVEVAQLFHPAELLGLHGRFFQILLGSTFDVSDLFSYLAGCALLAVWELWRMKWKS